MNAAAWPPGPPAPAAPPPGMPDGVETMRLAAPPLAPVAGVLEAILRSTLVGTDLEGRVVVDSAGTHSYHVGDDADARARQILAEGGYPVSHRARRFDPAWLGERDLILAMDSGHMRELKALASRHQTSDATIIVFRDFDPLGPGDVPDPYYEPLHAYRLVRTMVERSMPALLEHLRHLNAMRNP